MPSLASLLSRDIVVPMDVLERALERQALSGGELDTAVLELSAVPENVLAAYRAASFRLEPASRQQIMRVEPAVLACLPPEVATHHRVLPLAMNAGALVLAAATPLDPTAVEQIEVAAGCAISLRITTEARVAAALEHHYGVGMSERLRKLARKLEALEPGRLGTVPPPPPTEPAPPRHKAVDTEPLRNVPRGGTLQFGAVGGPSSPDAPVQVTRTVSLGLSSAAHESIGGFGSDTERTTSELSREDDPNDTKPARPSKLPGAKSVPPPPMDAHALSDALAAARDRQAVVRVVLDAAERELSAAALLDTRDKHLVGYGARGLSRSIDITTLEAPMSRALLAIVLGGQPRVIDLLRDCPGDPLASLLGREGSQPCVLFPISLGKRVVALLYGDRNGESFELDKISSLVQALPNVGRALERILHERKSSSLERRTGGPAAPPSGAPSEPPEIGGETNRAVFGVRAPVTEALGTAQPFENREIGREMSAAALRSLPKSQHPPAANESSPTIVLPKVNAPDAPEGNEPPRVKSDSTQPQRAPNRPEARDPLMPVERRVSRESEAPPRLFSQAPAGAGSYALRSLPDDVLGSGERDSGAPRRPSVEPPAPSRAGRAPASTPPERPSERVRPIARPAIEQNDSAQARASRKPKREAPRPSRRPDPRVDEEADAQADAQADARRADPRKEPGADTRGAEVVSMSPSLRESLLPPRIESSDGLAIDLVGEADRLVARLVATTQGEEGPIVAALLQLGDAGLSAIVRRFPGPTWSTRSQLHKHEVAARDLGPLPRALWAFEERMLPAIAELLEHAHPEARLHAAMLAGDSVHVDLLWPLYRKLFDDDGSVRLLVAETLPLYRYVPGFGEILISIRQRASNARDTILHRLAAIEAIASLRDPGSVPCLTELAMSEARQISVPAHRALVAITGQDFGTTERKWSAWYAKHKGRHRAEWLIDGLLHSEERVRAIAGTELQKLTKVYYGFVAGAPKRDRERAHERHLAWWQAEGKTLFKS